MQRGKAALRKHLPEREKKQLYKVNYENMKRDMK